MSRIAVSPAPVTRSHQMKRPIAWKGQSPRAFLEISGNLQSAGSPDLAGCDSCMNRRMNRQGHTQTPCLLYPFFPVIPVTPSKVKRPLEKLKSGQRDRGQSGNRRPGSNKGKMASQGHNGSQPIGTGHRDPLICDALQSLEISRAAEAGGGRSGSFRELARRGGRGTPAFRSLKKFPELGFRPGGFA